MRIFDFNAAIVRRPGRSVVKGLRANSGPAPDFEGVSAEHRAYVDALRNAGVGVTVLDAMEEFPDSMFVEDPALVFSQAAVLLRPGAPTRLREADQLAPALVNRFPRVLKLAEGYVDGGDVLVTPRRVLIGVSARTSDVGANALQSLLTSIGIESQIAHTPTDTLHLKSDCSLIDEETVLCTKALADSGLFDGIRTLTVPHEERAAANALRVNEVVFVSAACPRAADALDRFGVNVVPLSVTEISKIDAGLSCMSLRWYERPRE
jgi:dimethylargininase